MYACSDFNKHFIIIPILYCQILCSGYVFFVCKCIHVLISINMLLLSLFHAAENNLAAAYIFCLVWTHLEIISWTLSKDKEIIMFFYIFYIYAVKAEANIFFGNTADVVLTFSSFRKEKFNTLMIRQSSKHSLPNFSKTNKIPVKSLLRIIQ